MCGQSRARCFTELQIQQLRPPVVSARVVCREWPVLLFDRCIRFAERYPPLSLCLASPRSPKLLTVLVDQLRNYLPCAFRHCSAMLHVALNELGFLSWINTFKSVEPTPITCSQIIKSRRDSKVLDVLLNSNHLSK